MFCSALYDCIIGARNTWIWAELLSRWVGEFALELQVASLLWIGERHCNVILSLGSPMWINRMNRSFSSPNSAPAFACSWNLACVIGIWPTGLLHVFMYVCLCVQGSEEPVDVGADRPDTQTSQHTNVKWVGECSNAQIITSMTSSVWTGWLTRGSGRRLGVDVAISGLYYSSISRGKST